MAREGLLIGEVAKRTGASRKALRLYEASGILPAPRRSGAGYRVYEGETLAVLAFVRQAQRFGFTLDEIKQIVALKRAGRAPCRHVGDLVRRKMADVDRTLADLAEMRHALGRLLRASAGRRTGGAVCPRIEATNGPRKGDGTRYLGGRARSASTRTGTGAAE